MLTISRTDPPTRTVGAADHGRLLVTDGSPLHLLTVTRDVLLFPRGPAVVAGRGARRWFADPLSAVWCAAGDELICRSHSGGRTRFDWFAVEALIARAPAAVPFLRRAHSRRLILVMPLPPALDLIRRCVHRTGGEVPEPPSRAWHPAAPVEEPPATDLARRTRELLSATYTETVPVGRLARALGCSEGHLSRTFKSETGMTIVGYRHGLRLCAALDRLETDGDDLAALACDLGYASHSHFTSRFERTFGLTPSAFRRWVREAA